MIRFHLTAGSASEACEQLSDQKTALAVMRTLNRKGGLSSEGGRSPAGRIKDAEKGLQNMEGEYRTRFGRRAKK